jgi:Phage integrase SAM-like domain
MPTVHYYLKRPDGRLPRSLIFLQFKYKGRKLVYSFGRKINAVDWSKERQRVKSNRETILNGLYDWNELLDELERACLTYYQEELLNGIPATSVLKFRLDAFIREWQGRPPDPAFFNLLDRFVAGDIRQGGKDKSRNTLKNYATTKGHLRAFEVSRRSPIHFENIDLEFYHRYVAYLRDELHLKPNSIATDIGVIKRVMGEAVESGQTTNIKWRHRQFHYRVAATEHVWLTEKEVTALYRYDPGGNRRLESVRDLFVLSCFTGLPIADCAGLRAVDIVRIGEDAYLRLRGGEGKAGMTIGMTIIFCHPLVREILAKYPARAGRPAGVISNQKFNEYIKEFCRLAGFRERGRLPADPGRELWKCISSATAKRTFEAAR